MKLKVRTQPIDVFYVTGDDATEAHAQADDGLSGPGFVTSDLGMDGLFWPTAKEFESDFADGPGKLMGVLKDDIANQRELMQDDILCILDFVKNQDVLERVCQVIVDRMAILADKVK